MSTDSRKYAQVLRFCAETPWAIRAEKFVAIREMLALRAGGERFTAEEIQERIGAGPTQRQSSTAGTVAVLPLYGVITPRADLFTEMSGGTSVQAFSDAFRAAVASPEIGAILIDIDSPGGMTDLVPELAAEVRGARGSKPIVAIANTDAASAAYWVGSQASEFVITPSGHAGSIGVFAAHDDVSGAMEQEGIKTTLVSAGKFKTEANPFEPLSDEARAAIQSRVDAFYSMFTRDVAKGRGVSVEAVRSGFGEGRIVTAAEAVKAGMVDRVDTFEATVERLIVQAASGGKSRSVAAFAAAVNPTQLVTGATSTGGVWTGSSPPIMQLQTLHNDTEAAESGLSFAQTAVAVRDAADRLTADAGALRVLTAAKRDVLSSVAESLAGSSAALARLVAESEADPGSDMLGKALMADAERRHFPATTGAQS